MKVDPLYTAWRAMRARCTRPSHPQYADYGGRGITIDPHWDKYANFAADTAPRPIGRQWSLERKNNSLGYSKANCKWALPHEQARNTRANKLTAQQASHIRSLAKTTCGKGNRGFTQSDIAVQFGIDRAMVSFILHGREWA